MVSFMTEPIEHRRKRLLYRAMHRGFKEADLLLGGFAQKFIHEMSVVDLDEFEELIAFPDRELYEWATGRETPPANIETNPVFQSLRTFNVAADLQS